MAILCSGSVAIDSIMVYHGRFKDVILPDKIHMLNVAFHVPQLKRSYGGTAANIAFNLRLLGEDPVLLAAVGGDFRDYAEWLDRHGIRRDWIKELPEEATAGAYITTDLDRNQIIGFHPGAMDRAHEARLDDVGEPLEIGIVSPNGKRAMIENARGLKEKGIPCVVDPGQGLPLFEGAELLELLDGADTYVVNDYEWELTLEKTGESADAIARRVETVAITKGERGSVLVRGPEQTEVPPAPSKNVVDPTGCGDAWRAGYLYGRRRGLPLESCARIGSVMGSLLAECEGTQTLRTDLASVKARYEREFGAAF